MLNTLNTFGHQASAFAGSLVHARTKSAARVRAGVLFALTGTLFVASTMSVAQAASDLNTYAANVSGKTNKIVDVITYISYIGGAALAALGIVDLKKHVENPSQTPMKNGLAKLGFGGMLLALPFLAGVAQGTVKDGQQVQWQKWDNKPQI